MPAESGPLVERDAEIGTLGDLARRAAEGHGSMAVVSGPAGIGKSSVLDAVAAHASGARVLRAAAHELEQTIPFGVTRQLFEREFVSGAEREGASALAAGIFGTSGWTAVDPGALLHGLYWFVDELARERPLVLLVDDVQWCDEASLLALGYLARRLADLPVLLVLAAREESAEAPATAALSVLLESAGARVEPTVLSASGVAAVLARHLAEPPDDAFAEACFRVTGGNPFLVTALAAEVRDQALPPTAETAHAVGELAPGGVSSAVRARLHRLSVEAQQVAEALAVLGDGVAVGELAEFTGLTEDAVARAAVELRRGGLVTADTGTIGYVHALVRTTVLAGIDPLVVPGLRRRAAATLQAHGRSDAEVAAHLAEVTGLDDPDLDVLRSAADAARSAGAPQEAVALLRHVYDELADRPAADAELGAAARALGEVAAAAGHSAAVTHLEQAVGLLVDEGARASAVLALARAQKFAGAPTEAARMLVDSLQGGGLGDALQGEFEMELLGLVASSAACRAMLASRLAAVVTAPPSGSPVTERDHMVRAVLAFEAAFGGSSDLAAARASARAALQDQGLPTDPASGAGFGLLMAAITLMWCDEHAEAEAHYTRAIEEARRRGAPIGLSTILGLRALSRHRSGRLASAEADAVEAMRLAADLGVTPPLLPCAVAIAALAGIEREATAAELDLVLAQPTDPDGAPSGLLLDASGRVRATLGDLDDGLALVLAAGSFDESIGILNPTVLGWRSDAARLLSALGRPEEGRALVDVELERARAFGAGRAIGVALSACATTASGDEQVALLQEAAATLAGSPDRLEEARARVELGAALRRGRRISEARHELGLGLDAARRCGATRLVSQALDELRASGARPRRTAVTGVEALTASERRVAELAASGSTNRIIAQQLFVSEKTVETHLSRAYDKLGVRSRAALPELLASA